MKCTGSIKAARIESAGAVDIAGSVHSDSVRAANAKVDGGGSIGSLTCDTASINKKVGGRGALFLPFMRKRSKLSIDRLVATGRVDADHCTVGDITADSVYVGRDCTVGRIRFKTDCRIEQGAEISQKPQKV